MKIPKPYHLGVALALINLGLGNPGVSLVEEGNRLFAQGKYDQALAKYTEAQLELPESPEIYYNIGGAQYRKSDYEKAGALFKKIAESRDRALAARAGYNLGNTLFRSEDYQGAAAAYKATLKLNPEDKDAKYNYELARQKLQEQQQEQQQQEQQRQQQEQEKKEDQERDKERQQEEEEKQRQEQEQEEKDRSEQEEEREKKDQQQREQGKEERPPRPQTPREMNREDVERLLDALLAEEEDQRARVMKEQRREMPEVLRDW